jgi:hypothetical protein
LFLVDTTITTYLGYIYGQLSFYLIFWLRQMRLVQS